MLVRNFRLAAFFFAASCVVPGVVWGADYTFNKEVDGSRTSLSVYLDERVEADDLYRISKVLRDTEVSTKKVWMGFFLGKPSSRNSKPGHAWAYSVCDGFARYCDGLDIRITRLSKREWDAFGKTESMVPPDAQVIGIWRVSNLLDVSIYNWDGQLYIYEKWSDGSGTPVPAKFRNHSKGAEYFEEGDSDSWIVYGSGTAQAWEAGRPVDDFLALPLR